MSGEGGERVVMRLGRSMSYFSHKGMQLQRSRARGMRTGALTSAVSRLEQEHVALLLALCELEEQADQADQAAQKAQPEPMREALLVLLRDELRHTQHALSLAAHGQYGLCEDCHRPLSRRHLELKPAATRCGLCEAHTRDRSLD